MQELQGKVIAINGNKDKLYVLREIQNAVSMKIYMYANGDFSYFSQIEDIHISNPSFIDAFKTMQTMQRDVLIQSSNKFTRIYEGLNKSEPSLQDYTGFLPKPSEKSRLLIISGIRHCASQNRVLLPFVYPGSMRPLSLIVSPYFTDCSIPLQQGSD